MSVNDVIRRRAIPLTVNRPDAQSNQFGFVTRTSSAVVGVTGHMQPLSPKELRFVPEAMNTLEWWHIWSLTQLIEGDTITDGTTPVITVIRVERWVEGDFYHAQGALVDDQTALPPVQVFVPAFVPAFV